MKERERNKRLQSLIEKLDGDQELMELLGTMVNNDTNSMKMTFKLWTEASPIAYFLGVENLGQTKKDDKCSECSGDGWVYHSKGGQSGDTKTCQKCNGTGKK